MSTQPQPQSQPLVRTLTIVPHRNRRPVNMSVREWLWREAGMKCHWCNCDTIFVDNHVAHQTTIDHVQPRSAGGTDIYINLVAACSLCNMRRNEEFQRGMTEGALLGNFKGSFDPKGKTGTKLKSSTPSKPPMMLTKIESLERQRDQANAEIRRLHDTVRQHQDMVAYMGREREDAKRERDKAIDRLDGMTFKQLFKRRLLRWLQKDPV